MHMCTYALTQVHQRKRVHQITHTHTQKTNTHKYAQVHVLGSLHTHTNTPIHTCINSCTQRHAQTFKLIGI